MGCKNVQKKQTFKLDFYFQFYKYTQEFYSKEIGYFRHSMLFQQILLPNKL